jgi:hypothetical protein
MAVTTTESIDQPKLRCPKCGRLATGGVVVNGVAGCCATGDDLAEILRMVGDQVIEKKDAPTLLGIDPFGRFAESHPSKILDVQHGGQTLRSNPRPSGAQEELGFDMEAGEADSNEWRVGKSLNAAAPMAPALPGPGQMVPIGSWKARRP